MNKKKMTRRKKKSSQENTNKSKDFKNIQSGMKRIKIDDEDEARRTLQKSMEAEISLTID